MEKVEKYEKLGEMVRRRRLALGLTQSEAAAKAYLTQAAWSMVERGKRVPSVLMLHQIAQGLDCRVEISFKPLRICQVAQENLDRLTCTHTESGGYYCERLDPHGPGDQHTLGRHTVSHAQMGNGYSCGAIDDLLALR